MQRLADRGGTQDMRRNHVEQSKTSSHDRPPGTVDPRALILS